MKTLNKICLWFRKQPRRIDNAVIMGISICPPNLDEILKEENKNLREENEYLKGFNDVDACKELEWVYRQMNEDGYRVRELELEVERLKKELERIEDEVPGMVHWWRVKETDDEDT